MARGSILPRRLKNGEARYDVTIELPPVNGTPVFLTDAQGAKAKEYLASHWSQAIG